jgi:RimJ/RimL family protein N-acetyltransferase
MDIRPATMEDALAVLEWRNDPQTVGACKTGSVDRDAHLAWFAEAIADPKRVLRIATDGDRRIGMIRFDRRDDGWLVSINIAPDERGKGYGERVLRQAMLDGGGSRYLAEIKSDNLASIRIFERCGFRQIGAEDGFLHFVRP